MEDTRSVVIDLGSGWSKVGFAGAEAPQAVFPTVVGRPKFTGAMAGMGQKEADIGDEALAKQSRLTLTYPIEHGIITNWDDLVKILTHTFYDQLSVAAEEQALLILTAPLTAKANLEKLTQILFDTFGVPALSIATQGTLALTATGRTTGIVLDSGYGNTVAVPMADGNVLAEGVTRLGFAGRDLTDYLVKLLNNKGMNLISAAERASANTIKEQHCYVALDFASAMATAATNGALAKAYELPDGRVVTLGTERFGCPEALFQPTLLGKETGGIHTLIYQAIMKCEAKLRPALFANIVLAGGTTLLPGLPERLEKELTTLAPPGTKVEIVASPARHHLAWLGGSSFAAGPNWQNRWISRQEYANSGPSIINRKFF